MKYPPSLGAYRSYFNVLPERKSKPISGQPLVAILHGTLVIGSLYYIIFKGGRHSPSIIVSVAGSTKKASG